MKFLSSGDLHVKIQNTFRHIDRLTVTLQVIHDMTALAIGLGINVGILDGDIIDKAWPEPEVLLALHRAFFQARLRGVLFYWMRGNHEIILDSKPSMTAMDLFGEVCVPIMQPKVLDDPSTVVVLIPFHPDESKMKAHYKAAVKWLQRDNRRHVLVTHVGLKEGTVAPSNIQIPQRMALADLLPDYWDLILLADYHDHQFLAPHVFYQGAPIPHTFGDQRQVGPWLVDMENDTVESLMLPSTYPAFCRWTVNDKAPINLLHPGDYNEIRSPVHLVEHFQTLYPTSRVLPLQLEQVAPDLTESRISVQDKAHTPTELVDAWLTYKNKKGPAAESLRNFGIKLLTTNV